GDDSGARADRAAGGPAPAASTAPARPAAAWTMAGWHVHLAAALDAADRPTGARPRGGLPYLLPDRAHQSLHPAPGMVDVLALAAGQPLSGHPGRPCRDRSRDHPAARREAVVGLSAAVHLAAGARSGACDRAGKHRG